MGTSHQTKDVAVMKVGSKNTPSAPPDNNISNTQQGAPTSTQLTLVPGLVSNAPPGTGIVGVAVTNVTKYDEALVGNDVIIYGYPRSLVDDRQLDPYDHC
jgi:hypothetical protein